MFPLVFVAVGAMIGFVDQEPTVDLKEYNQLKAVAGRDADSQVKLALWCEAHGLETERMKHLAIAVLANPSHTLARGLLGLVEYQGKWKRPDAVASESKLDVAKADLLAEYHDRRVKTPVSAAPQYKLALWCEEHALKDEARAHLATVVRLDPKNAEAWRKLGYKKVGNRWVTNDQATQEKSEKELQAAADKKWKPILIKLKDQLKAVANRDQAQKSLAEIHDARAVPMVLKVFGAGAAVDQRVAVQLLGQIDAIEASRGLVKLALLSETDEIRARAIETLRRRDAREWADIPVGLLRQKIVYVYKPVGGAKDPGMLEIKTKTANYKRLYKPGAPFELQPGDQIFQAPNGETMVARMLGVFDTGVIHGAEWVSILAANNFNPWADYNLVTPTIAAGIDRLSRPVITTGPNVDPIVGQMNKTLQNSPFAGQGQQVLDLVVGNSRDIEFAYLNRLMYERMLNQRQIYQTFGPNWIHETTIAQMTAGTKLVAPLAKLQQDAVNSLTTAAEQLKGDKEILDKINLQISQSNTRALAVLSGSTGQTFGEDRKEWEKWLSNQVGYASLSSQEVPTIVEVVPSSYQPTAVVTPSFEILKLSRISCFGKGTMVQTSSGPQPIEDLQIGDLVLSQDVATGKLRYKPIVLVHHNPPSPTYKIAMNGADLISSYFHRFWKVGHGWVMARDLQVGDTVRVLSGVAKITKIETAPVQPVFNLDIADDSDFFAGPIAALVHDNTLPDLKQTPFDAPASFATLKP